MSRIQLVLRRTLSQLQPRRFASTHVASILHDAIGVTLPHNRRPIILPPEVSYAYNELLVTLRDALKSAKPRSIYVAFSRLQNAGHADNLGPEDVRAIDAAIAPTVLNLVSKPSVIRPTSRPSVLQPTSVLQPAPVVQPPRLLSVPTCEPVASTEDVHELALWLAVRGQICLLRACMLRLLNDSNPSPVIDLWHAYAQRSLAGEGDQFLEELPHPPPHLKPTTDSDNPQKLLPYYPGRPELLTLTICAYTMLSDFRSAFHTSFTTLIPLKLEPTRDALEPLIDKHEKAVFDTLQAAAKIDMLRMLARPWSFRAYLMNPVESKTYRAVQRIWDEFIKLVRADEPWVGPLDESSGALPVISTDPDAKPLFSLSRQTWCDWLEAASALRPQLPTLTQSIWAELHNLNVTPTTGMWNTLLAGYATHGDFNRAWAIWDEMRPEGRDAYTYTSMIQALFERRETDKAVKLFEELKSISESKNEPLNIRTYNVLLHGLFSSYRIQSALDLLSQLESTSSPTPDTTTYNIQLRHYARKRDMIGLSKALKGMAEREIVPDAYTFVTVLDALLGVGVRDATGRILEIMAALGVEPNAAVVGTLLEHVVRPSPPRQRDQRETSSPEPTQAERLQIALKMLLAFEQAGIETNVVNYTALMAAFQRSAVSHDISHVEAQNAIKALRERMKQRRIQPNRVTFNLLIAAALDKGPVPPSEWNKLEPPTPPGTPPRPIDHSKVPPNVSQAVKYLHDLRGANVLPNHDTWYVLLNGVASWGQIRLARVLCDEMLESGFIPQTGLLKLVLKIRGGR